MVDKMGKGGIGEGVKKVVEQTLSQGVKGNNFSSKKYELMMLLLKRAYVGVHGVGSTRILAACPCSQQFQQNLSDVTIWNSVVY